MNKIKLNQLSKLNLKEKFSIFYKYRFNKDYLKYNINKKKFNRNESIIWFKQKIKSKKLFAITLNKKIIGLIIYNLNNKYYSITIDDKYRNMGYGYKALVKFIEILKKKRLKLITIVSKKNKNSIHLHKKLTDNFKNYKKDFIFFKIL